VQDVDDGYADRSNWLTARALGSDSIRGEDDSPDFSLPLSSTAPRHKGYKDMEHRKRITVCNLLARRYSNLDTLFKSEHHAPEHGVLTGVEE
jgi:hypothetical protein